MKRKFQQCFAVMLVLGAAMPAIAAETAARQDDSMTLVYLFLATCGLIIVLQLLPVFTLVYGLIKGIFGKRQEQQKPLPVKNR